MLRTPLFFLAVSAIIQFSLNIVLSPPSSAQDWRVKGEPRGVLRVVDLGEMFWSVSENYADFLVTSDKQNNLVPSLAEDWRRINERTIEFKLREGIRFHNGERFNAEALRINWQKYKSMKSPECSFY